MDDQLHLILAGETGTKRTILFSKKTLFITIFSAATVLTGLTTGCFFTTKNTAENLLMKREIATLEKKVQQLSADREKLQKDIATINSQNERNLNEIKVRHDLETTTLKLENAKLISGAVSELNERSALIESVMTDVGVDIKKKEQNKKNNKNKGGVFIPVEEDEVSYTNLLQRADNYLEAIRYIPVGRPTQGVITSRYGKRFDPVNKKPAFHSGIDLRGKKGDKVFATADGVVKRAYRNGGYGNFLEIDHGNGYKTRFAHLQNFVVKKGEKVTRGQVIGQVGNTGRSTGSHLHYEVVVGNKTVNPIKFMKIADLSHTFKSTSEK